MRRELKSLKNTNHNILQLPTFLLVKEEIKHKAKQPGQKKHHKGYARHIPERIDNIKALIPDECPHCGTELGDTQEIRLRHVTDIKLTSKVKNTRYDIHRKYCPKCKKLVELEAPNVLPHARFGLNLTIQKLLYSFLAKTKKGKY